MPKDETLNDIDTTDLVLQKLGDIEGVLTMRLQQAHKDGKTSKEDRDILVDLLGKIAVALTREVKDGEDGEDGEDCDPAEVAKLLEDSVSFIERVKGAKVTPERKVQMQTHTNLQRTTRKKCAKRCARTWRQRCQTWSQKP